MAKNKSVDLSKIKPEDIISFEDLDSVADIEDRDVVHFSRKDLKAMKRASMLSHGLAFGAGLGTGVLGTLAVQEVRARLGAGADVSNVAPVRQVASNR